jgi:hypothetical protein
VDGSGVTDPGSTGVGTIKLLSGPPRGRRRGQLAGTLTTPYVRGVVTFNLRAQRAGPYTLLAACKSDLIAAPALNAGVQTVTDFTGTLSLSSSDGIIDTPVPFLAKDNGSAIVGLPFPAPGTYALTLSGAGKTQSLGDVRVVSPTTHLGLAVTPAAITAGSQVTLTVTGLTARNKRDALFADALHVATSDSVAQVGTPTIANGVETITVTFATAGKQTITVTDPSRPTLKPARVTANVSAAAASQLVVNAPLFAVAGAPVGITVTAEDAFGNRVQKGFTDPVTLSTGASTTFKPGEHGRHVFTQTFPAAGLRALTASDTKPGTTIPRSAAADIDVLASAVGVTADPLNDAQQALVIVAPAHGGTIQLIAPAGLGDPEEACR